MVKQTLHHITTLIYNFFMNANKSKICNYHCTVSLEGASVMEPFFDLKVNEYWNNLFQIT